MNALRVPPERVMSASAKSVVGSLAVKVSAKLASSVVLPLVTPVAVMAIVGGVVSCTRTVAPLISREPVSLRKVRQAFSPAYVKQISYSRAAAFVASL